MYKIRITNYAWMFQKEFGEYSNPFEAQAQMIEYTTQSDADRWEYENDCWNAYVEGWNIPLVKMEVIEVHP